MELADVQDSKSCGGDTVWVRPPSPAPIILAVLLLLRRKLEYATTYKLSSFIDTYHCDVFPDDKTPEKVGQTDSRDEEQPSGGRRDRHYRRNLRKDRKD